VLPGDVQLRQILQLLSYLHLNKQLDVNPLGEMLHNQNNLDCESRVTIQEQVLLDGAPELIRQEAA
jgi:hypothetical protein